MKIGFIGFGEAARAFCDTLRVVEPSLRFAAWDRLSTEDAMRAAMAERGVAPASPDGLSDCDWIFSAVTADQSLAALEAQRAHLRPGQVVIDINSVSPGRKRDSAALVAQAGARYVDMAVMAPVHPRGHRTPVLVAGDTGVMPDLLRLGFDCREVGAQPGDATAIKMVRSLFVKGLEAITVECLLAAEASGCRDEIIASLSASFPGLGWPDFAAYQFERTLRHGARRAAEMRESAETLRALGLRGALADEIAEVQERMAACDLRAGEAPLPTLLAPVLAARRRV
ncbi:NAD(P)-dependent oxidoreductase [Halodurantibacterium flavum]|uniref:DUF1932 domain-containing protein n=1 Tax=Halodurantibacterium flavum TaxID=1382802 RepID=A0ABW4S847_9RHOB